MAVSHKLFARERLFTGEGGMECGDDDVGLPVRVAKNSSNVK